MSCFAEGQKNRLVRFVGLLFVVLCANTLGRMAETREIHLQIVGGLTISLILNAALLLSSFSHRSRIRHALGVLLIPSALGVAFVLTDYHLILSAFSLLFHCWLIAWLFARRVAA